MGGYLGVSCNGRNTGSVNTSTPADVKGTATDHQGTDGITRPLTGAEISVFTNNFTIIT